MIVTIDGPAGSGKSTAARKLAAALEIPYLDTGAMYRAVTWKALREGVPLDDAAALTQMADRSDIRLDCGSTHVRVCMDGHDVTEAIRSKEVEKHTSILAKVAGVREVMVRRQREIGRRLGSLVTEGRDQGSVVFPDAQIKFILDADDAKRAERRFHDMAADGQNVRYEEILDSIRMRDTNDRARWEPLLAAGQAVFIDTTTMSIDEVVERLRSEVVARVPREPGLFDDSPSGAAPQP